MAWTYPEGIADAVLGYIRDPDVQSAKLAEIAAAHDDEPLEMRPFHAVRFQTAIIGPEADFPLLFCEPLDDDIEPGVGGIERGFMGTYRFGFTVVAYATQQRSWSAAETAQRLTLRYLNAVTEMLAESYDPTLRPFEWAVGDRPRRRYDIARPRGNNEYIQAAQLVIACRAKEAAL